MRFPKLGDLDKEQRTAYADAPVDGAILVAGAPGTGKTVLAFHRAQKLAKLGQAPSVIMYNNVLQQFTASRGGVAKNVPVSTFHKWVPKWWRKASGSPRPPTIDGQSYVHDWDKIVDRALALDHAKVAWGHLLIDEGQDFSEQDYVALGSIMNHCSHNGADCAITVFADDNQRLSIDRNCDVNSIRKALRVPDSRLFKLQQNYRNTLEIARFARWYYEGHGTGVANLPEKKGNKPLVHLLTEPQPVGKNPKALAELVARTAQKSAGKSIGVIVFGDKKLVKRLKNQVGSRVTRDDWSVQFYLSGEQECEELDFDAENTITFIHQRSGKGLEFDIVFIAGLETMSAAQANDSVDRMALYVMCSRARQELHLVFAELDPSAPAPHGLGLLPPPDRGLCRYLCSDPLKPKLDKFLESVDWKIPRYEHLLYTEGGDGRA